MEAFTLHILGVGSALPTLRHNPSAQALSMRGKIFIIDCGEGCQLSLRRSRLSLSRIRAIFISHLHGDHVFGLPGLLSTLSLLGRSGSLAIHGPVGIKHFVECMGQIFWPDNPYQIEVYEHESTMSQMIYEDASLRVTTLPLRHRLPTTGYLFEEKRPLRHLDKAAVDFYHVPIAAYRSILAGEPYTTEEGTHIPNSRLTKPGEPARKYAYVSDTAYHEALVPLLQGVDLLYHEATYMQQDASRATETWHSTAVDAATIARKAAVHKLLLGHYSARYDDHTPLLKEAREVFPNTELASEGDNFEL